ncbi:tryptophan--tRNA ligase, mitochondrial isoform X1 [Trichogramma pretiosum]|uniref:tryptophan--tRNA ligase, mitochondrial isoform X1 n=2 Tax=Trichogramma pretiosum TaxID=7493 RepID=UPI0006C989E1|nr:tryptophan--tRNA ligase, mitochondrial isoform X1 [Trichogramma pretiosum]
MMLHRFFKHNKWNQDLLQNRLLLWNSQRNCSKKPKKVYPKKIFSGIQPTGTMHLGNYAGAIKNWVDLQNKGEDVIWSIVDMHSITLPYNPSELKENVFKLTATLLACGIDPEKSILFQQSSIPMHAELSWIFACLATMPRLSHQPQFKEKSEKLKDVPLGLYIYPILQTADILLYKATHVPVGDDQLQHIQLSAHLAQKFNSTYGETFAMPQAILNSTGRIKSLRDPTEKMSKSSNNVKSRIDLTDTPDILLNKIKKAVTDFKSEVTYEPDSRPGVANLINIHSLISGKTPDEICTEAQNLDTGKYKLLLADLVIEKLNPIRKRIDEYLQDYNYLQQVLQIGASKAETIAMTNWLEVRNKVGYGVDTLTSNVHKLHLKS